MADDKIVILGARGMLGTDLTAACLAQKLNVTALDLPEFDITNKQQLANAIEDADAVINCAAYTNVEKAESETKLAFKINADAAGKLGELAKDAGAWVLHIGTDFIFDGNADRPYVETDKPNPINCDNHRVPILLLKTVLHQRQYGNK